MSSQPIFVKDICWCRFSAIEICKYIPKKVSVFKTGLLYGHIFEHITN